MKVFGYTGTDILKVSGPLQPCFEPTFVDRDERLEDCPIDCIIHQENVASRLQPSMNLCQTCSDTEARKKVKEPGIVDAVEGGLREVEMLGKLSQATYQLACIFRRRSITI